MFIMAVGLLVGFFHFGALSGFLTFFIASFIFQFAVNFVLGNHQINQCFENKDTLHNGMFSDFSVC